MADQAFELRNLMINKENEAEKQEFVFTSRVITITSGKGGVGKSNFAVNIALELCKAGKRVIVIDADFGLANIEVLLGHVPKHSLLEVINGQKDIEEVISQGPNGLQYISGGSGLTQLADMSNEQVNFLIEKFAILDKMADIILIDTGAGISKQVVDLISASSETVIMTTPEPTSITDAYAIIKTVNEIRGEDRPQINIVVNRVDSMKEGDDVFQKLNRVCEKFLSLHVNCLGYLPQDSHLIKAVKAQTPVSILYPQSPVSKSLNKIAMTVLNSSACEEAKANTGFKGFIKKFANMFK